MLPAPDDEIDRPLKPLLLLCAVVALMGVGLIVYSRTAAFVWDEGFHLLAARLILAGKTSLPGFLLPANAP